MGGSYRHITDSENRFKGIETIDHLGDALEALEECYDMIEFLSEGGDKKRIYAAHRWHLAKHYKHHRPSSPEYEPPAENDFEEFWSDE
jgi:hypothetical protein